jgi:hypothetical protein
MDLEKIKDKKIVQRFRSHKLSFLIMPIAGWFMGDLLNTPTIKAFSVVLLASIILAILLDVWIKSKISNWFKTDFRCYCAIYLGLLIICVLIALPFRDLLVFMCDRNNPYKQPLTTCSADVQIIVDSNAPFESYGHTGYILFVNGKMDVVYTGKEHIITIKGHKELVFEMVSSFTYAERTNVNRIRFGAKLENVLLGPSIGKPVYKLSQSKYALLHFDNIPNKSKIISGLIICIFNGSLRIEIPVPLQIMGDDKIIIPEIRKYFLAPVKKEINYEIFTTKIQ